MTDPIFQAALASARPPGPFICGACGLELEHELHTQSHFGEFHNFDWIRKEIRALVKRGNITVEENEAISCNSYERELMIPALTDEAFVKQMEYCLKNCEFRRHERPASSYNDAVLGVYAPEILRRFKELFEPPEGVSVDEVLRRSDAMTETLELADRISDEWETGNRRLPSTCGELSEGLDLLSVATRNRRERHRERKESLTGHLLDSPSLDGFKETVSLLNASKPEREAGALSVAEMAIACKNIGFDLTCGVCAEQFYTGGVSCAVVHDPSCGSIAETRAARDYAETIDNVRVALGQENTHYLVIADDVKALVEAVEKQGGAAAEVLAQLRKEPGGSGEPRVVLPRTPDGHINNCALANGELESSCQVCNGACPDRERYTGGLGVK